MLIVRGADAGAAASDGTTPWYTACEHGSMDVLRVLQSCGVDMEQAEEDGGTSPVHIGSPLLLEIWMSSSSYTSMASTWKFGARST